MNLPLDIKNKIESLIDSYKISDLKRATKNISDKYLNESGRGDRLVISKQDVLTYAVIRMPATFAAFSKALKYTLELIDDDIESVLDLGSGTGSVIVASKYLLNHPSITCLEREKEMINFAREVIDEKNSVNFIECDSSKGLPDIKADLVTASYFYNELDDATKEAVLEAIWEKSNKYILIVEPGTPTAFSALKKARDFFLKKGGHIIAPCPHADKCPLAEDDWCHFVTRVARSRLHKLLKDADVPYEDEKFSYLAISKEAVNGCKSRILRHPLIQGGRITLELCTSEGNKETKVVTKSNKESFKIAKKSQAGDIYE